MIYVLNYYRNMMLLDVLFIISLQLHFSGNFWWTTTLHPKSSPKQINENYLTPEMFIGYTSEKNPKYCSFISTNEYRSIRNS